MVKDKSVVNSEPPVKEGQELVLEIQSVGGKGDGIAKVKGFVIFLPGVKKGERVKARINKVTRNAGFASVIEVLSCSDKEEITTEDFVPKKKSEEIELHEELDSEDFGEEE